MLIEHGRQKLIDVIIYFAKKTKYCGKTKLCKLLYFLDFKHFRETGKPVTNLTYSTWPKGPVPVKLFEEIDNQPKELTKHILFETIKTGPYPFLKITPRRKFDKKYFSKRELRLLESIAFIFKDARSGDMVDASHLPNHPWDKTKADKGLYKEIDYLLAIDNTEGSLSLEETKERIKDKEEIMSAFNA